MRDKVSSVITYDSQLRGFERISLKPGETRQVTFSLKPEDLQILDRNMNWTVEPGEFEVMIGASSQDIRLKRQSRLCLDDSRMVKARERFCGLRRLAGGLMTVGNGDMQVSPFLVPDETSVFLRPA